MPCSRTGSSGSHASRGKASGTGVSQRANSLSRIPVLGAQGGRESPGSLANNYQRYIMKLNSLMQWNLQSYFTKFTDLKLIFNRFHHAFIIFQETCIKYRNATPPPYTISIIQVEDS